MKFYNLVLVLFLAIVTTGYTQVSVIANKSVSDASLTKAKVAQIFSLDLTKWSNGEKIIVFDNASDVKAGFYAAIGKDAMALKKEWLKKQLTGEAKAPASLGSDGDVISKVSSTSGSIGFVKSGSVNSSVKVLVEFK